jgi:DNA-binding HxlR family transcriptional regulator
VACVLDIVGDRWTLLVIRDLFAGKATFAEFAKSPERIASNILADRLQQLVESGLVERASGPQGETRRGYALTAKGRSLLPVLQALANWGLEHIPGTRAHLTPGSFKGNAAQVEEG